jgi:hypothetical protein
MNVEILVPFKYFKAGQVVVVSEAAGKDLIAKGYAAEVKAVDAEIETKEKPKKEIKE